MECSRPKTSECIKKLIAEGAATRAHHHLIIDPARIEASLRRRSMPLRTLAPTFLSVRRH